MINKIKAFRKKISAEININVHLIFFKSNKIICIEVISDYNSVFHRKLCDQFEVMSLRYIYFCFKLLT